MKGSLNPTLNLFRLEKNEKTDEFIDSIVKIHMQTFENFFLTFLGDGFLRCLYKGFAEHKDSGIIVACDNDEVVGFVAFSNDISDFYKYLLRKKLFCFAWYSFIAFLKKPTIMLRLLRAFMYPSNSSRTEKYVELSSIGVKPSHKNQGIGSKLIDSLKSMVDFNCVDYIKLETDAENNEATNAFYLKNGFVCVNTYETQEGRKMNEYCYKENHLKFYCGKK